MFNILSRDQQIHRSYFLEASAGTGKTFSIVHLALRQLLEAHPVLARPLELEEILLVTFTRASTRELKQRFNHLILTTIHLLEDMQDGVFSEDLPDYLLGVYQQGEATVKESLMRLERALILFDRAQIFTIHSFCYQMLQEFAFDARISLGRGGELEDSFGDEFIYQFARDFLRCREESISTPLLLPGQFKLLGQHYRYQVSQVLFDLVEYVTASEKIVCRPPLWELLRRLQGVLACLKERFTDCEVLQEALLRLLPYYKKICDRKGEILPHHRHGVMLFCRFVFDPFDPHEMDRFFSLGYFSHWIELIDPANRNSRKKGLEGDPELDALQAFFTQELRPLLYELYSPLHTFAHLANQFQTSLVRSIATQRLLGPNEVLFAMRQALSHEKFCHAVQDRYQIAIIDEFQDTDAVQWGIFSKLFLTSKHLLCLVGDPKQSIYAFRRADIYTYLAALQEVGSNSRASLLVNYRSHPNLVKGLNCLFSSKQVPQLFPLPKHQSNLVYHSIEAGVKEGDEPFPMEHCRIHFMLAEGTARGRHWPPVEVEERALLPAIAQKIKILEQAGVRRSGCALLVRDRYQAARAKAVLLEYGISAVTRRSASIADGLALPEILGALFATQEPYYTRYLYPFLTSRLIGLSLEEIVKDREDGQGKENLFPWYEFLMRLQSVLYAKGIASWLEYLLHQPSPLGEETLFRRMLRIQGGKEYLSELYQISDALLDLLRGEGAVGGYHTLQQQMHWLLSLAAKEIGIHLKKLQVIEEDAVEIITLHMSKGLEFEYVFAIGLCSRTHDDSWLLLDQKEETIAFTPYISPEMLKQHQEEACAEKMRQLYVAMTRAKQCLYLPIALPSPSNNKELLFDYLVSSPIEIFLYHHLKAHFGSEMYVDYPNVQQFLSESGNNLFSFESCGLVGEISTCVEIKQKETILFAPSYPLIVRQNLFTSSYTSLTRHQPIGAVTEEYRDIQPVIHEELKQEPRGGLGILKGRSLPAGRQTGILLHQLLQEIPIALFSDTLGSPRRLNLIQAIMAGTLLEGYVNEIENLLYHVGQMSLPRMDKGLPFHQILTAQVYREMEFLFPVDETQVWWKRLEYNPGMIAGVIDLIFLHEGYLYVIDWKSNDLGMQIEDYGAERLKKEMISAAYDLQAMLYAYAMERFILLLRERGIEVKGYGGTFYVFLRGLHQIEQEQYGIYYLLP
jgi:exodeoxyribonuclease V beta subunit